MRCSVGPRRPVNPRAPGRAQGLGPRTRKGAIDAIGLPGSKGPLRMKDVNDLKLNPLRAIAIVLLCDMGLRIPGPRNPGGVREPIARNPRPGE